LVTPCGIDTELTVATTLDHAPPEPIVCRQSTLGVISGSWRTVATIGAFMSLLQFALLYSSMHAGMPPGLAALVLQVQVIFTIVIAAFALRERPSGRQVAGVVLGSVGFQSQWAACHVPRRSVSACRAGSVADRQWVARASGIRRVCR
jgi:O-acetylserine/cysteine efflux transporter